MDLSTLLSIIRDGKSGHAEFKREPTKTLQKEIAAFANADGGHILIGVNDQGTVIGTDLKLAQESLASALQSIIPPPAISTTTFTIEGKEIFVITVKKGEYLCSVGGVVYIRIGTGVRPLSLQEVLMLASELGTVNWDQAPLAPVSEAKKEYIDWFFLRVSESRGKTVGKNDRDRYLRRAKAVKEGKLTNAGVLFFTDATESLPQARIRLVAMEQDTPQWNKEFAGPVWRSINAAVAALLMEIRKIDVVSGTRRIKLEEYPPRAIREALINAVAHRNYTIEADIRIFLYPDRLIIRNPGSLLPGVDLNDPEHIPRNPALCNLLHDTGYIERYGLGIRLIRETTQSHGLCTVDFVTSPGKFEVVFRKNLRTDINGIDKRILSLITTPKKSGEIARETNIAKVSVLRRLKVLDQFGLVRKTGEGPQTRYVLRSGDLILKNDAGDL